MFERHPGDIDLRSPDLEFPFIYIAALRRTGSTLLSEALTSFPDTFVFREPKWGEGEFALKDDDCRRFTEIGIDLRFLRKKWIRDPSGRSIPHAVRKDLIPRLSGRIRQLGVKEIHHSGWKKYRSAFPDMRVVITGRDPRDIYVSLHHRLTEGLGSWQGSLLPERVANDLNNDFALQLEMADCVPSMRVRYEDLCRDPQILGSVLAHACSPLSGPGTLGGFLAEDPRRAREHDIHRAQVTRRRVGRWKTEADSRLVAEAHSVFEMMSAYTQFWGYSL